MPVGRKGQPGRYQEELIDMGKCPRCPWKGSAKMYAKHFASKHHKKAPKAGKVKKFKVPAYAKGKRR